MPNPIPSVIKRTFRHFFGVSMIAAAFSANAVTVESLVSFNALNPIKGLNPKGSLIVDANGDLLGVTELGGTAGSATGTTNGFGTIFRLNGANPSSLTTVHEFAGGTDGFKPQGPLLKTKIGSDFFYFGTTAGGQSNLGTIFRMAADGTVVTLKEFASNTAGEIGSAPSPSLVEGNDGLLYGTTTAGGLNGGGTLFRIAKTGEFAVLRQFSNEVVDCVRPSALIKDQDTTLTNLYGVTAQGGVFGRGTVFKYTTQGAGTFKVLVNFGALLPVTNGIQPQAPKAALALASSTTLVGTTTLGGTANFGTVFRISTTGTGLTFLSFTGNTGNIKGSSPEAPLFLATDGNFYGTTRLGGKDGFGTVFKMNSTFTTLTTLVEFEGAGGASNRGAFPISGLLQDNERNLYGTTSGGGENAQGMVYRLANALPLKALATTSGQLNNSTTGTRSTITGLVTSPDSDAKVFFEYGTDTSYGKTMAATPALVTRNLVDAPCKAALSGLLPDTDYHYRIVAQNAGGTTWGEDIAFHTSPHPRIVTPPLDTIAALNEPVTLNVVSTGDSPPLSPLAYQWLKNGAAIVGATKSGYTIPKAVSMVAGSYAVRITKNVDINTSTPARLAVISTSGGNVSVNEGKPISLTLTNYAPTGSLEFQWSKNGSPLSDGGRISGALSPTLTISGATAGDNGPYACTVTLGTVSRQGGTSVVNVLLKPVFNPVTLGPWTTNGVAFGTVSAASVATVTYGITNPPSGVKIDSRTGVLSGQPVDEGPYLLSFTATNAAGTTTLRDVPVQILPASINASGSFTGLIARAPSNSGVGGLLSLLPVSAQGVVTAKIIHAGKTYSAIAALSPAPGNTRNINFTAKLTGAPDLAVLLTLDEGSGDISGTINGATVSAKRNIWSAAFPPTLFLGITNVLFSPQATELADAQFPHGQGFLSFSVANTGVATWQGKLADGTALTGSSFLGSDGSVPVHHALYAAIGSAQGLVTLAADGSVSSTGFGWYKPAQTAATRSYKDGFALHSLDLLGSKFVKPGPGVHVMGLTGTASNAKFSFTDGGLAAELTQLCNFPATNLITFPASNANLVKITKAVNVATGIFEGSFTVDGRLAAFAGIVMQGSSQAHGFFNLPGALPTATTSPLLSGKLTLAAP